MNNIVNFAKKDIWLKILIVSGLTALLLIFLVPLDVFLFGVRLYAYIIVPISLYYLIKFFVQIKNKKEWRISLYFAGMSAVCYLFYNTAIPGLPLSSWLLLYRNVDSLTVITIIAEAVCFTCLFISTLRFFEKKWMESISKKQ